MMWLYALIVLVIIAGIVWWAMRGNGNSSNGSTPPSSPSDTGSNPQTP
ncbi:MAG TPA: hypothetical protein P5089_02925 [Candidatus Portnoybacteria bacterium]|nr:hypothetical protein [Candidatus Portnoybacteria bacterium]